MTLTLEELARRFGGGDHSVFAPSSSAMWMNCPGSLIPNLQAPDSAGADAAEGTAFHEVMETWLREKRRPQHLVGVQRRIEAGGTTYIVTIDDEMMEFAADCIRWVTPILPHIIGVEWKVDFSDLTPLPRQRGTADLVAYHNGVLYIRDWKFGRGVPVYAEHNTQLLLYAYGAYPLAPGPVEFVNVGIGQPRLESFTEWQVPFRDLVDFGKRTRAAASAAWSLDAPRVAGPKQCQWCKVKGDCPVLMAQTSALVDATFDDLSDNPRDPKTLTTEALANAVRWRKTIEAWLSSAEEELQRRVEAGESGHGFKVVKGRSRRAWKNPDVTMRVFKRLGVPEAEFAPPNLVSPNQAESVLKAHGIGGSEQKNLLAVLVHRPPGKPTLVQDRDPRPALPSPGDAFGDDMEHGDL